MASGARVESVDALAAFRVAMVKFLETATSALGDGESDITRTIAWLENDQHSYWTTQIRQRQELLARAQEALRQKTLFKDSAGRTPSAVEEQKAVLKAQQRLQEAVEKMAATKSWSKRLQKEMLLYKGAMGRFQNCMTSDIPAAIGHLGLLITTLQEYIAMAERGEAAPAATVDPALAAYFGGEGGVATMSRGQAPEGPDAKKEEPKKVEAVPAQEQPAATPPAPPAAASAGQA